MPENTELREWDYYKPVEDPEQYYLLLQISMTKAEGGIASRDVLVAEAGLADATRAVQAWRDATQEHETLLATPLVLPKVGEYLCWGGGRQAEVIKIKEITEARPVDQATWYMMRESSAIKAFKVGVNGQVARWNLTWTFSHYAALREQEKMKHVVEVLAEEVPEDIREAMKPLIPFIGIPEGEFLCKATLRKLAIRVARGMGRYDNKRKRII